MFRRVMSVFTVRVTMANLDGTRQADIDAVVDIGAHFSKLPRSLATELGVVTEFHARVRVGDNRILERDGAFVRIRYEGTSGIIPVTLGVDSEVPLLGATALEYLGLAVDSTNERLVPTEVMELAFLPVGPVSGRETAGGAA